MEASFFAFTDKSINFQVSRQRHGHNILDIQGIILNHFVLPKTTVTGNYYATVIKSELLPAIGILLHDDKAPSHSSRIVMDTVNKIGIELLPHPPRQPRFSDL